MMLRSTTPSSSRRSEMRSRSAGMDARCHERKETEIDVSLLVMAGLPFCEQIRIDGVSQNNFLGRTISGRAG